MGSDVLDVLTDVNAVIIPITPGHVLIDVGVNSRHDGRGSSLGHRPYLKGTMATTVSKERGTWGCRALSLDLEISVGAERSTGRHGNGRCSLNRLNAQVSCIQVGWEI